MTQVCTSTHLIVQSETLFLIVEMNDILQGTAKLPAVCDYIKDLLESGDFKFLIYAHHHDVMDGIHAFLKGRVDMIRIDGSTSPLNRSEAVTYFQTESSCRVALLSITAAGVGTSPFISPYLIYEIY